MINRMRFIFGLLILSNLFAEKLSLDFSKINSAGNMHRNEPSHIIGIMVQFQEEIIDNPLTSGNGLFLNTLDVDFIAFNDKMRCNNNDHILLDPPPHDRDYFLSQLKAVNNYFANLNKNFNYSVLDEVYTLDNSMSDYAISERHLTYLYIESLQKASNQIDSYMNENNLNIDEVLFVVFHAGLGQDITAGIFDPTVYDIHSAYIDENMISYLEDSGMLDDICIESCWYENKIDRGILLPETLNMIYYDVIEDVLPVTFVSEEDLENIYCDSQSGITGLFSYLLGYAFNFPPMHNTENGFTRIGKFGLMDQGSFNGRGIIPALPNSWTRTTFLDTEVIDITDSVIYNQEYNFNISKRSIDDIVYKIQITENEYFLLENSSNKIEHNNQIMNFNSYVYNNDFYWMDAISSLPEYFHIDENGVLIDVEDYDIAMPGSGILIWHIIEPNFDNLNGINNNIYNKAIHLEEGDGIVNLGYLNPMPGFLNDSIPSGWRNDYWYKNNQTYLDVNNLESNSNILFNNESIPNSNLSTQISSLMSLKINDDISDVMNITVSLDLESNYTIELIDPNLSNIVGNNGDCIYYLGLDDEFYEKCGDIISSIEGTLDVSNYNIDYSIDNTKILFYNNNKILVNNLNYYIDPNDGLLKSELINPVSPVGYFYDYNSYSVVDNISEFFGLGDIDKDGYDEIVEIVDSSIHIKNSNGTYVNGFPISDQFYGYPLIIDLLDIDGLENYPEIICKNHNMISIIDYQGNIYKEFPLFDSKSQLFGIASSDSYSLFNGNRVI